VISRFTRGYEVVAADIAEADGTQNSESKISRYYYTVDEHGSTTLITDKYSNIKNEYHYDAFGNVLESKEQVHNRITYAGQQFDGVTGQYYLRARFYNPVIGRFTQEDIYRGDGLNLYAYCANNPIVYYDPSGFALCPENKQRIYDEYKDLRDRGYTPKQSYDYMKYKKLRDEGLSPTDAYNRMKPKGGKKSNFAPDTIAKLYEGKVSGEIKLEHTASKQASTILSDELAEAGIGKPAFPTETHHIVPHKQARVAAEKLERLVINRNSSANGVRLPSIEIKGNPQTIHSARYSGKMYHGSEYIDMINEGIDNANSYSEAMEFLNSVRRGLLDGSIDVYK
jgi:RHS repeat-associated protein